MFFKKKSPPKDEPRKLPIQEVYQMSSKGMNDKDIIKSLKSMGYSYDEIEAAMMQTMKEGVKNEGATTPQSVQAAPTMQQAQQSQLSPLEEMYAQSDEEIPTEQYEAVFKERGLAPQEEISPETIIEELVEGVVEEKWHKFEEKLSKFEESLNKMHGMIKQMESRNEHKIAEPKNAEFEMKIDDFNEHMEDLQVRVGGLEKAFQQFLPSLTKNIESLSRIIHEMKEKQGYVREEYH